MNLYGNEVNGLELEMARMHMRNKTNRIGYFTKSSLQEYAIRELGIPRVKQSRMANGRFSHNVSPADRFADRVIQRYRSRLVKSSFREGNVVKWAWLPRS